MSDVETPGDVWGRERDVEKTVGLWLSIREGLRLEETLGLPPIIPRRLDSYGVVTAGHRLGEVFVGRGLFGDLVRVGSKLAFLLARRSGVHECRLGLLLLLLGFYFLLSGVGICGDFYGLGRQLRLFL